MNRKETKHLSKKEKIEELKIGNLTVEIKYAKGNYKFDECILNILKRKIKIEGR